ncbi:MAG TPA: IspD/TarI family cytidylyltransferase [Pseudonocardia sp.]|nr:IspD/TarI family cytidylyltransferase [Pseudonocardia sp.]
MPPTAAALVLAGGTGSRLGADRNKVLLPLAGRAVIARTVDVFVGVTGVDPVVLVVRRQDRDAATAALGDPARSRVRFADGGASRQESELSGLRHLAPLIIDGAVDVVLVHDGARPLVSAALVRRVLGAAREHGGAVPAVPAGELGELGPGGRRLRGPAPAGLVAVQTPQAFRAAPLLAAYERAAAAGFTGTDTASCVERFTDLPVVGVPGEPTNIKITYRHDLALAERLLHR